jgi:uroporphyrinogen-III synthase
MAAPDHKPLVWITRAEPGASATAARVAALGYLPVASPLLRLEPTGEPVDLDDVAALAFTSINGVRAFADASAVRDLPAYAVGDATAEAARAAGFTEVASADGDVSALAALLASARPKGLVLHPGAAEPAGDLVGALAQSGIAVRPLALYRAVDAEPTEALTLWERLSAVLIHSPRAGRALEVLMAARAAPNLRAVVISPAAAEPLKHLDLAGVAVAPLPKEQALLNLLLETNPL